MLEMPAAFDGWQMEDEGDYGKSAYLDELGSCQEQRPVYPAGFGVWDKERLPFFVVAVFTWDEFR